MIYAKVNNKKFKFQHIDWCLIFLSRIGIIKYVEIKDMHPHDGNYKQIYPTQINDILFMKKVMK